jgi:polar amino acid transport system substrate-binding protein
VTTRTFGVMLGIAFVATACGSSTPPPPPVSIAPAVVRPAGAVEITEVPAATTEQCDAEASLRPSQTSGPALDAIRARGRLIVGVDQNTFNIGYREPNSGDLEGFDIDLARELARSLFGDPNRIDLQVVDAQQRESALQSGQVDLVVRTFSITCERRKKVDFSTVYFYANQRILSPIGSQIDSPAKLSGKRVCALIGTTSLTRLSELQPRPNLIGVERWTDCLVMLQQGQIDAISTDDVVLAGLAAQDPSVRVVGPSLGIEPYGVGVKKGNDDLVRYVNAALERIRTDGTWERLYTKWFSDLGPSPAPPQPKYRD